MDKKEIAFLAARYADEKKAEHIKVIDLNGLSSLCDYIVLATVTSKPHMEAVEDEISTQLKKIGVYKSNRDGGESMIWRVSDYGSFLVHIMTQEARDFYALDKIFSFGTELNYKKPKTFKKKPARKASASKAKAASKKTALKKTAATKTAKKPAAKKTATKAAVRTTAKTSSRKAAPKKTAKTTKKSIEKGAK